MAWESVEWSCGHTGDIQLYGHHTKRESTLAFESGRPCMACWLVKQWEQQNDPRAQREDRYALAAKIAAGKGKRIYVDESVPVNDFAALTSERQKLVERILQIDELLSQKRSGN